MTVTHGISRSDARTGGNLARKLLIAGLSLLVLAALYGRVMGFDLRRDEFMFVPPAVLLGDYALYHDLFFNHVPLSAWIYRGMYLLLPWMDLMVVARLTVFLTWLLLLGSSAWIGWRLTRSGLVAMLGPVSLLAADVLLAQTGMAATNNLLPMPFALLGLGLFAIALAEGDLPFGKLFLAGFMLSIAAGLKASAIAFVPAVAIGCFLVPRGLGFAERARRVALPVALGGVVGALPLFWLAATQTDLFFAHIAGYHSGPHVAFWQENAAAEPGVAISAPAKLQLAYSVWMIGGTLLALFIAALAWVLARRGHGGARSDGARGAAVVVLLSGLTAAALSFVPTPGFPQYYAPALIVLPLLTALRYRAMPDPQQDQMRVAIAVAIALMGIYAAPRLALGLADLRHPDKLAAAKVQRGADALRQTLAAAQLEGAGPVATLSPLYPLAAGLQIYPELSAGPFAYRVADYTDPELRAHYAMVGPDDLPALLDTRPPAAIMTGFDPGLDDAFADYARANGFTPTDIPEITDRYGTAVLWLSPRADAPTDQTGGTQ